ncbi:MAG: anti-sigma factor [Vicinamibacterales bacterium]
MTFVPCSAVRPLLEAFHDGELPLESHLEVRDHLESCAGCAAEASDLRGLSELFEDAAPDGATSQEPPESWTGNLLVQVQVERQLSWHTWLAGVFDDMHLVWPALGGSVAVLVCVLASTEVMQATTVQRPDSLAGVIDYLASPGSNVNPVRIDEFTMVPRRRASSADWPVASGDAVLTLSTVVTREGRIAQVRMLGTDQPWALKVKPEVVLAMIEAASQAQFEPARAGGTPVAVNLVWLLAHTTVVGSAADVDELLRPQAPAAGAVPFGPHAPSPAPKALPAPVPPAAQPSGGGAAAL